MPFLDLTARDPILWIPVVQIPVARYENDFCGKCPNGVLTASRPTFGNCLKLFETLNSKPFFQLHVNARIDGLTMARAVIGLEPIPGALHILHS